MKEGINEKEIIKGINQSRSILNVNFLDNQFL
jgi:hypothetical protein